MDYVQQFFDVGLLQSKVYPYLAVSLDGVALIHFKENEVYACVEIKTRVSKKTIEKAEKEGSR